jgi:hypothetical protein
MTSARQAHELHEVSTTLSTPTRKTNSAVQSAGSPLRSQARKAYSTLMSQFLASSGSPLLDHYLSVSYRQIIRWSKAEHGSIGLIAITTSSENLDPSSSIAHLPPKKPRKNFLLKNDITLSLSFPSSLLASLERCVPNHRLAEAWECSPILLSLDRIADGRKVPSATRSMVDARFGGVGARGGSYDF